MNSKSRKCMSCYPSEADEYGHQLGKLANAKSTGFIKSRILTVFTVKIKISYHNLSV